MTIVFALVAAAAVFTGWLWSSHVALYRAFRRIERWKAEE